MEIFELIDRPSKLINNLIEIWEDSIKATHLFLSSSEIKSIKKYVPQALLEVDHLLIIKDKKQKIIAFAGVDNQRLEMLFIKNSERGKGYGKQLLNHVIKKYQINELTVNEQNPQVVAFYKNMEFNTYKRTEIDEQGNPYPLLYMKL